MSNHVTPSIGRIVWYRGQDNIVRAAIVTHVWSQFLINLHAFGKDQNDQEAGIHTSVTHGDIEHEPNCCPSWSWMPYQKGQAAKTEQLEQGLVSGSVGCSTDVGCNGLLPHQQRVVNERDELVGRMAKLYDFINESHPVFSRLDSAEQDRLRRQLGHMTAYAKVLGERIAAFQQVIIPESAIKSPEPEAKAAETSNPVAETIRDYNELDIERLIQAKSLTAPRVTPQDIEANIVGEHYFTAYQGASMATSGPIPGALSLLTFCVLVLRNGFTVTGESACASPENFDAELGCKIARQNAVNKIWPLMGYALKQRLHDQQNPMPTVEM